MKLIEHNGRLTKALIQLYPLPPRRSSCEHARRVCKWIISWKDSFIENIFEMNSQFRMGNIRELISKRRLFKFLMRFVGELRKVLLPSSLSSLFMPSPFWASERLAPAVHYSRATFFSPLIFDLHSAVGESLSRRELGTIVIGFSSMANNTPMLSTDFIRRRRTAGWSEQTNG